MGKQDIADGKSDQGTDSWGSGAWVAEGMTAEWGGIGIERKEREREGRGRRGYSVSVDEMCGVMDEGGPCRERIG